MEAIQAEMQKHFKITAKKKLYFALACMFHESRKAVVNYADTAKTLLDAANEEDSPKELQKAALMSLAPLVMATRPVYCMAEALKEYKAAMGEYPEFTKFMIDEEKNLEGAINKTLDILGATQKLLDAFSTKEHKAPRLKEGAFGKDFIEACEKTKIKGE